MTAVIAVIGSEGVGEGKGTEGLVVLLEGASSSSSTTTTLIAGGILGMRWLRSMFRLYKHIVGDIYDKNKYTIYTCIS